ncbi:unnamed protein product [Phaeothamnion confervicola]
MPRPHALRFCEQRRQRRRPRPWCLDVKSASLSFAALLAAMAPRAAAFEPPTWYARRMGLRDTQIRLQAEPLPTARSRRRSAAAAAEEAHLANLEKEYWSTLDPAEYKVSRSQALGLEMLKLGQLDDALQAFDEALAIRCVRCFLIRRDEVGTVQKISKYAYGPFLRQMCALLRRSELQEKVSSLWNSLIRFNEYRRKQSPVPGGGTVRILRISASF